MGPRQCVRARPLVRMVAAQTTWRLPTTLRYLAFVERALGVVSEMPPHEPGAQSRSLGLSPQIVIEQADRHQGRQTTNDQAVPRTSRSGAPVTGTDRDEYHHDGAYHGQAYKPQVGPDQQHDVVDGIEASHFAEVSGAYAGKWVLSDELRCRVHHEEAWLPSLTRIEDAGHEKKIEGIREDRDQNCRDDSQLANESRSRAG